MGRWPGTEDHPAAQDAAPAAAAALHSALAATEARMAKDSSFDPVDVHDLAVAAGGFLQRLDSWLARAAAADLHGRFNGNVAAAQQYLQHGLGRSPDLELRRFTVGPGGPAALLAYIDGMADARMVDQDLLALLQQFDRLAGGRPQDGADLLARAQDSVLAVGHVSTEQRWAALEQKLVAGNALVFLQGVSKVLVLDTVQYQARSLGTSHAEPAIKGPQEAFGDIQLTQINQLRRRIKSTALQFAEVTIGRYTQTKVLLAYVEGLTNPALVGEVLDRLHHVDRDEVQMPNQVITYISGHRFGLFPISRLTDRVDVVARELLMGKLALMVQNDPFVALFPNRLIDFYQTTQDYAFSFWEGSLGRLVRLVGLLVGLYTMPLYLALTFVNPNLMPTKLILTVAGSRLGVPFPPVTEVIIMWIIIEVLREAANRLPQQMATTIGTVGAVVVGTAIVKAGVVDDIVIVAVTLTALGFFTTPTFEMTSAWRWLFWALVGGAYLLGIYGIVLVSAAIIGYLSSMETFGVPYFSPFGPLRPQEWADAWVRLPHPLLGERPQSLRPLDRRKRSQTSGGDEVDLRHSQQAGDAP